jgi:ubiquitin carboxyl-terminal hydrolase 8
VPEIKEKALHDAHTAGRGASAIALIKAARTQMVQARDAEGEGDLKGALSRYFRAASLVQMFLASAEFKAESAPGKRGVLWKEFADFQQVRHPLGACPGARG